MLETFHETFWRWSSAIRTVSFSTLGNSLRFYDNTFLWNVKMNICGWKPRKQSEMQLDSVGFCPKGLPASLRSTHGYQSQFHTRHWCCVWKQKFHKQNSVVSREMHGTETERATIRGGRFRPQIISCVFNRMTRGSNVSRCSAGLPSKWLQQFNLPQHC